MRTRLLLASCALALVPMARADVALVVGVGEYPSLPTAAPLDGAKPDAESMAKALKNYGFNEIKLITNQDATKPKIFAELDRIAKTIKPNERFVFYFAGHGTRKPKPSILPSDAKNFEIRITADELKDKVTAIKGATRTIILDACFAGGMTKSVGIVTRYFEPEGTSKGPEFADEAEQPLFTPKPGATSDVCYVTAALNTQEAIEYLFENGERRGLFTYNLVKRLDGTKRPWSEIVVEVQKEIQKVLQAYKRQQNPQVNEAFQQVEAFSAPPANGAPPPAPAKPPADLLTIYASTMKDPSKLLLKVEPNEVKVSIGQPFTLVAEVKAAGYLVILGEQDGNYYRIYPQGSSAKEAEVRPGDKPYYNGYSDMVGGELAKAFLFKDEKMAQAVLDACPSDETLNLPALEKRIKSDTEKWDYVTATVSLRIEPTLLGGLQIADPAGFWKTLSGSTPEITAIKGRLDKRVDNVSGILADEKLQTPETLAMWLNRLVMDPRLVDANATGQKATDDQAKKNVAFLRKVFKGVLK